MPDISDQNASPEPSNIPAIEECAEVRRGYWAGWKDIARFSRPLWVVFALIALAHGVYKGVDSTFGIQLADGGGEWGALYKLLAQYCFIIVLGSTIDWLGLRRSIILNLAVMLLVVLTGLGVTLAGGTDFLFDQSWLATCAIAAVISFWRVFDYKIFAQLAGRAYLLKANIASLIFVFSGSFFLGNMANAFVFHRFGDAMHARLCFGFAAILAVAALLVAAFAFGSGRRRYPDGGPQDLPPRPAGPFAGFREMLRHPAVSRIAALTFVLKLLVWLPYVPVVLFYPNLQLFNGGMDAFDDIIVYSGVDLAAGFLVLPILFPIADRLRPSRVIIGSSVLICVGAIGPLIPLTGMPLGIVAIVSFGLIGIGAMLGMTYLFLHAVRSMPVRREGSFAALLMVAFLLAVLCYERFEDFFSYVAHSDWPRSLVAAINPDAHPAHAMWLFVFGPAAVGTALLIAFRRYFFKDEA